MWTREMIKTRAKFILKKNYWEALAVSVVIGLVGGGGGSAGSASSSRRGMGSHGEDMLSPEFIRLALFAAIASLVIIAIWLIVRITVGYCLEVGGRKFFIRAAEGESKMGYLGYCFKEGRYLNVLGTMLLRGLYTFLWSLLLIIPGIIKSYAYSMVPYILADNPKIGYNRAIELSNEMTRGEKFNMWVLDLSFLGWYILGTFALCIGVIFVRPYEYATKAELYLILRKRAIESNLTSYKELNLEDPSARVTGYN